MPRHFREIKPFCDSLSKYLRQKARDMNMPEERAFVEWFIENRFSKPGRDVWYTDQHNDGEIDAIVKLPQDKIIVIQSKYNKEYSKPIAEARVLPIPEAGYTQFDDKTIPAIMSDDLTTFNDWLNGENISLTSEKGKGYKEVFDAYNDNPDNVSFILITTHDSPTLAQKPISPIFPREMAHGNKKAISKSNIIKRIATR